MDKVPPPSRILATEGLGTSVILAIALGRGDEPGSSTFFSRVSSSCETTSS